MAKLLLEADVVLSAVGVAANIEGHRPGNTGC